MNKRIKPNKKSIKINMIQSSSCLSDVDVKMSEVHILLSEINQILSTSPVPVQSTLLLPRVEVILSEITWIVSLSQSNVDKEDDGGESLGWDYNYDFHNNNYYNLNNNLSFSSISFSQDDDHVNVEERDDHDEVKGDTHHDALGVEDEEICDDRGVEDEEIRDDRGVEDEESDALEDDGNIADRVMSRRRSSAEVNESVSVLFSSGECSTSSPTTSGECSTSSSTPGECSMSSSRSSQANTLIDKVIIFIPRIAPDSIYSKKISEKRRKRRTMKLIHPELIELTY